MTIYSHNGSTPAPLPFRIRFADGSTRTDPATFTASDLESAGYVEAPARPSEFHAWNGSSWVFVSLEEHRLRLKTIVRQKALARSRAGTTGIIGGASVPVASTDEAVARLQGVPRYLTASGDSSMNVVMSSGAAVSMTAADANTALAAVDALYAACEAWQHAKFTALDAATSHAALNAVDLDTGLPS